MLSLVFDQINGNSLVPNLTPKFHDANHEHQPPYTSYPRLAYYAQDHLWPIKILHTSQANSTDSFYLISLSWFDFNTDYFALLSPEVVEQLHNRNLTLLFYYHEGDNPYKIKQRLDYLSEQHKLDTNCYRFISGNSAAGNLKNFVFFADHELLYWRQNRHHTPISWHQRPRRFRYTLLSRTHKWWRATVVADLWRSGRLEQCQWSYGNVDIADQEADNPLRLAAIPGIRAVLPEFLKGVPYQCDSYTSDQHNQHDLLDPALFTESYFHLVLETMFDLDGSNGAFVSEKTFKCIKHAVPFVLVGAPGSLQLLRDLGYKVYDSVIDNSYDQERDNDRRWRAVKNTLDQILQSDLAQWHAQCQSDAEHNQKLFLDLKIDRLNNLSKQLYDSLN